MAGHGGRPQRGALRRAGRLLTDAALLIRGGGSKLALLILASQLVIGGIALPFNAWLFREALRASGMSGLDTSNLSIGTGFPLTLTLIALIILVALWAVSLQFTALIVLLRSPHLGARAFAAELLRTARRLLSRRALPFIGYLFILLPFAGFGFTSALTQRIAIPSFISDELMKTTSGEVGLAVFLIGLTLVNIRLSCAVPVFVLTDTRRPMRDSVTITRGFRTSLSLVIAVGVVLALAAVVSVALILTAIVPTAITDAVAPSASPAIASVSLGIAQVLGLLLIGYTTACVAAVLTARTLHWLAATPHQTSHSTPHGHREAEHRFGDAAPRTHDAAPPGHRRGRRIAIAGLSVIVAAGGSLASLGSFEHLAEAPETLVLAHRGFSDGGVENTIGGLEAAKDAGADLVEMDVLETKDGEFVVMHDPTLGRLSGRDLAVKDLTLAELTKITVRDRHGNTDTIPSLADYVTRAAEIDMPLLLEIKLGGADSDDHVDRLVDELETLGVLEQNIYHSLDPASVERLKRLRPDLTVGYTMAFAGGGVPHTDADMLVIEGWTATERMQDASHAAGLGFMAWTINDEASIRALTRRGVDGIITDHPDLALEIRDELADETGITDALVDAVTRFVTL